MLAHGRLPNEHYKQTIHINSELLRGMYVIMGNHENESSIIMVDVRTLLVYLMHHAWPYNVKQ